MRKLVAMIFAVSLLFAGAVYATEHAGNPADNATAVQSAAPATDNGTAGAK